MIIISRQEAKEQGLNKYFTGKPCKNGHVAERTVGCRSCLDCKKVRMKANYWSDPETYREYNRQYEAQPERKVKRSKAKRSVHGRALGRSYAAKRRELVRSQIALTELFSEEIQSIYKDCVAKTKETGIEYHVDHIVPITNETICGLHVPWNLQIITAKDNLSKGNRLREEET